MSVTDEESSWTVSAFQGGTLVLEKLDDSDVEPRHLPRASRMEMIRVRGMSARGDLAALQQLDRLPGYEQPTSRSPSRQMPVDWGSVQLGEAC
ncbi:hypothetical protein ACFP51_12610 [Streptomyces pratens]|uniref:Uncharacterized protein n=1 Tax=Streptomyces pratens TaxID=887456 RepID=A0ABW1MAG3_9ACTN